MAETLLTLGQVNPSATTLTTLYTVPAVTSVTASSIVVCNQAAASGTFRIAIRVAGASIDPKHYIYYDELIAANATFIATIGITLATTDVVSVYASASTMSFNLFGVQIT